ncbi:YdeI/OmpD-associated family protein [Pelolinea submarina]|uniref:Uncharacterized protein YdeI (YjbR/CyaY-like superfamily) n=1 Tax=Pelolinea submarina TaxID=913107 RepID=A0A347ZSZ9_9CHLR|nr:DUF1801 domain-containing protein [Pelolinea submarina]REG10994.1 uncharacterized protein YdeI (YjbR/CyaY-like superfamily) [Pelolinea submarina]BBB48430.1 hypothetical protein Pelsub_P1658 [Pelolinea submarina]
MGDKNLKVDTFMQKASPWQAEYRKLREIVLSSGLDEDFKWMHPCYTSDGSNVVLIHGFKDYCALLFIKGALLKDPKGILVQQTEQVQAARQVRFRNLQEIVDLEPSLKAYIQEAIDVEKSGIKLELKKTEDFPMPDELKAKFRNDPELKKAFEALTPGRQHAYQLYFSQAKQAATREARIEKSRERILAGIGLNE